jgi:hypothetical protein
MNRIPKEGKSFILYRIKENGYPVLVSVLSRRAAKLVCAKSLQHEWHSPVLPYKILAEIEGGFLLVGFQPETGLHIAIKDFR